MESSVSIISHSHISIQALKIEIGYFVTWEGERKDVTQSSILLDNWAEIFHRPSVCNKISLIAEIFSV